jgi:hypothetical protein
MAARVRPISKPAVPRLALSKTEAADALGVSVDFLEEHVLHELKVVRRGRRRLIPLSEPVRTSVSRIRRRSCRPPRRLSCGIA